MTDKRAAALHEAGHALALFHFNLLDKEGSHILRDRGGEYVGVTQPEDGAALATEEGAEGHAIALLCGYYAEVAFDGSRREQALVNARHDFETLETALDAEYGPAAPFHMSRLRKQARSFVQSRRYLIDGLARELEEHGHINRDQAEELVDSLRAERRRRPPGLYRVTKRASG